MEGIAMPKKNGKDMSLRNAGSTRGIYGTGKNASGGGASTSGGTRSMGKNMGMGGKKMGNRKSY